MTDKERLSSTLRKLKITFVLHIGADTLYIGKRKRIYSFKIRIGSIFKCHTDFFFNHEGKYITYGVFDDRARKADYCI